MSEKSLPLCDPRGQSMVKKNTQKNCYLLLVLLVTIVAVWYLSKTESNCVRELRPPEERRARYQLVAVRERREAPLSVRSPTPTHQLMAS